jgi:hypothetical protein
MSTDANNAASSAAPTPAPAAPVAAPSTSAPTEAPAPRARGLADLSAAERHTWRMTGALPDATDSPSSAESAPAQPAEQAASTDASSEAASEPAAPGQKKGVKARIPELDAEIVTLREKLRERALLRAELEQPTASPTQAPAPDAQPGSSPAVRHGEDFPEFDAWATRPENAGRPYEAYTRELAEHVWTQRETSRQIEAARSERVAAYQSRVTEAAKADPEFYQSLSPAVLNLRTVESLGPGERPGPLDILGTEIMRSEHAAQLMRHYSTHAADLQALARMSPRDVLKAVGRLEARFDAPTQPASTPTPVTQAPDPPVVLGNKATAPVDDADAALARGDFRSYRDAANRRELAARR